nr:vegetative cell wall protein gp1 [Aegilops tauschii subsp. strangulata]
MTSTPGRPSAPRASPSSAEPPASSPTPAPTFAAAPSPVRLATATFLRSNPVPPPMELLPPLPSVRAAAPLHLRLDPMPPDPLFSWPPRCRTVGSPQAIARPSPSPSLFFPFPFWFSEYLSLCPCLEQEHQPAPPSSEMGSPPPAGSDALETRAPAGPPSSAPSPPVIPCFAWSSAKEDEQRCCLLDPPACAPHALTAFTPRAWASSTAPRPSLPSAHPREPSSASPLFGFVPEL